MRVETVAIILFAFAALSLASGIPWLTVVFAALGLAMLFFYKEARETPEEEAEVGEAGEDRPAGTGAAPQQVIVMQEGSGGLNAAIAQEIITQAELERTTGHAKKLAKEMGEFKKEHGKEVKSLKKELRELKEKLDDKKKK